jgi:thiosulfate reductase cytochrome b subunit
MKSLAFLLLIAGSVLIALGLLFLFAEKVPWLGNLPGDIHIRGRNFSFHFPLMTCILLSVVITIVVNIILEILGK